MQTVLILLAVLAVVGVGLGFYLGWFNFSSLILKGKPSVALSMDKDKIEADKDKVVDKAQALEHKAAVKLAVATRKAHD